ncbi:hypothetical protein AB6A40_009010 [Gnathostoma spinigerum]|uniref:FAD linked oxidase N-terminal domain-containing protein n=1 Tax=Gnathostoma spinigerum TaxID=75299 RepID=A0ABD6EXU6_9BILA
MYPFGGVEKLKIAYKRLLNELATLFRWLYALSFALPFAVVCEHYSSIRCSIMAKTGAAQYGHRRKVAWIQNEVRDYYLSHTSETVRDVQYGWTSITDNSPQLNKFPAFSRVQQLSDIIELDLTSEHVRVEPMIKVRDLLAVLIPAGYTLPVVPDSSDLTVYDLVNGCGVGPSGRKYGMFHHCCLSYEMVTCDGSLITASKVLIFSFLRNCSVCSLPCSS